MIALHQTDRADRAAIQSMLNDMERGLARQLSWRTYVLRVLVGVAVMAAVFVVLWLVGDANFRAAMRQVYTTEFAIYLPFLIGVFVIPLLMARHRHAGRVLRALLDHRICPHCGYDLRGIPADPSDGAAVCPECACAWRLAGADDPGR